MEKKIKSQSQPKGSSVPEIKKEQDVKAAHLSSNPINGRSYVGHAHFESEVENAFFRVFFGC